MEEYRAKIISTDDMRQPTNLELAQMIMIQGQATLSLVNFILLERDILTSDEEFDEAMKDVAASMQVLTTWWLNLKPEQEEPPGDGEPDFI